MKMTRRTEVVEVLLAMALLLAGCATSQHLAGTVHGLDYTSAQGEFSVPFPVSSEVGGRILKDTPERVTFSDNWGSRITFLSAPFAAHSSMTAMLETQGREKALSEFARRIYGDLTAIHYHPEALGGAISFIYLRPAAAKTGVAAFLHGRRLYLVETDMLPGVQLLALNDEQSQRDREAWLESRAVALAQSMAVK
jgi:hypothetical protein